MSLQLVATNNDRPDWFGANPADAEPPRVLSGDVRQRLAAANAVARRVRDLDVSITGMDITTDVPRVIVAPIPGVSLVRFINATRITGWIDVIRNNTPFKRAHTIFRGVRITLEIPQ